MIFGILFSPLSFAQASQSVLYVYFAVTIIVNDWLIAESGQYFPEEHFRDQELCSEQCKSDLPSVAQLEAGSPGFHH